MLIDAEQARKLRDDTSFSIHMMTYLGVENLIFEAARRGETHCSTTGVVKDTMNALKEMAQMLEQSGFKTSVRDINYKNQYTYFTFLVHYKSIPVHFSIDDTFSFR